MKKLFDSIHGTGPKKDTGKKPEDQMYGQVKKNGKHKQI